MTRQTTTTSDRHGEKGAALVIAILIATLLLAVAGTVILTSGMSATTSIEGTAELQAYYAAETGLEATLNVLRGHVAPHGIASTTRMNFRNAVDKTKGNKASDSSFPVSRLSAWLDYDDDDGRVTPTGVLYSYSVIVMDPDDWNGAKRNADATYKPTRVQVQSTGYGPNGSIKRMEMVVEKTTFDFAPKAMLVMRGADSGAAMTFDIGDSAAKYYTGHDNAVAEGDLPAFGVTHAADKVVADNAITKGATVQDTKSAIIPMSDLPEWLQTADKAREFLTEMQSVARSLGRYYTSFSGIAGTDADPKFTFVNGNATLDGGAGLMIVTGNLILNGNPQFKGVILVLGEGTVNRDGGGNGNVLGSIYIAKFARSWPSSENGQPHPFMAPIFHTDGGGTAELKYDSVWVKTGKETMGDIIRDIREF